MLLSAHQLSLLDALVSKVPHSTPGIDASRFRADHEDDLDNLDELEKWHYLERRDNNIYVVRLPALVAVRSQNHRAEESLLLAGHVFDVLRRLYKAAPGAQCTVAELATESDLPIEAVHRALYYLLQTRIWSGHSTNLMETTAFVAPAEAILKYKTFDDLIERLQTRAEPVALSESGRERQQKFGILDSPTLLASDLRQPSGISGTALVYLDLDNFKALNSNLTETVVDEAVLPSVHRLLASYASRIALAYGEGGDEFTILLHNFSERMAITFAEGLRDQIARLKLKEPAENVKLGASLGVAHVMHGDDTSNLKKYANEAKNFVKSHGKNSVAVWRPETPELRPSSAAANGVQATPTPIPAETTVSNPKKIWQPSKAERSPVNFDFLNASHSESRVETLFGFGSGSAGFWITFFRISGKNESEEPLVDVVASVTTQISGESVPLLFQIDLNERVATSGYVIDPKAPFVLSAPVPSPPHAHGSFGYTVAEYLASIGGFDFVFEAKGIRFSHTFTYLEVKEMIELAQRKYGPKPPEPKVRKRV